ncbi:MAG: efflux RND transporter periplasmic adaptor subunit [Clostridiales bacterium]|jgi:RND family efflux transporter MFP subunit|nr:efflux RND transporter periplasmic adaptor subunit [Clostridiales bacterium]
MGQNKKSKKKWIIGAVVVVFFSGAGFLAMNYMMAEEAPAAVAVRTMPLTKTTVTDTISVSGTIYSSDTKNIYSSQDFPIKEVYVEIGDEVKAGDVLAEFDMSSVGYELRQAENSILNAEITASEDSKSIQNSVTNAAVSLETARINLEKQQLSVDTLQKEYENGTSTTLTSAQNALDNAASSLSAAQEDAETKQKEYANNEVLFQSGVLSQHDLDASAQSLDTAKRSLANAQADYDQAAASLNKTKETLIQELEKAQKELESARLSYQGAQNTLSQAQAKTSASGINIDNQKITMEKLQEQLGEDKIIASIDGTITAVNVTVGEKPEVKSLFVIENMDNLYVAANVMEYDLADVTEGKQANITTDATDETVFTGEISYISPKAVSEAGSTAVEFETHADVKEKSPLLRIGMNAFMDIITESRENVYAVPYTAVTSARGESFIYSLENNTVVSVPVTVGLETSTVVEIAGEGLSDGMNVIVNPSAVTVGQTIDPTEQQGGQTFTRGGQAEGEFTPPDGQSGPPDVMTRPQGQTAE